MVGVFTNAGASSSPTVTLASSATGFGANQPLVDVMSCTAYTTDSTGGLTVTLTNGLPRVLYAASRLSGSKICTGLTGTVPSTASLIAVATSTASACESGMPGSVD